MQLMLKQRKEHTFRCDRASNITILTFAFCNEEIILAQYGGRETFYQFSRLKLENHDQLIITNIQCVIVN